MGLFNTSDNFIDGDKFENIGDLQKNITYLKIDSALNILSKKKPLCPLDHILITHNGDLPVTPSMAKDAEAVGFPYLWYAQNVTVSHPKIIPIPIGLERTRWFPELFKREFILKYKNFNIVPKKLCLANFSLDTNPTQRKLCLDKCSSFSTVAVKSTVIQSYYQVFIESLLDHFFVLCPEGNGVDTHRLWETLYLGRIPVVTYSVGIESFKDLPILIIPSWVYLSEKTLIEYRENFQQGKIRYSLDKLDFQYWEDKIKKQVR